ncbi:Unsaturated rhamnogalacturonyl hydrolase YesR [Paenibacillus solanacearum]|uniref:Unsaturated rhamnogalacturonyl hydrolase YesR n=1 Tax=Paenibacillus solanacearum TaxID=2048548 RepID=A0A916NLY4_9BACL|nr:glycoside hydrolase family 88 protein [Paenibacillus solanacearum]CAG7651228.1 Unsaturated rhamnogalacturonyl hydrolase YesR [Paenibacillus solanacearum]
MNQETMLHAIKRVSGAMKSMKNEGLDEIYPIGLIDIHLWEWPQGVGLYGMYQYYEETKDADTLQFLQDWFDARIREGLPEKNVNTCSPLLTLISLCELTGNEQYIRICDEWSRWIMDAKDGLIRTGDGAFQHMITGDPNDGQILIDTLFMTVLFLTKAGVYFNRPDYVEEAKKQCLIHIKYLYDRHSGLFFHGWDFNGRHNYGAVRWGRGNGWYTCGIVDFLDMVELEEGIKPYLLDTMRSQVEALAALQAEDGMWHTVLDDASSYKETSCTAAFGYGILKAVRQGYLEPKYSPVGRKALAAVLDRIDASGVVQEVSYGTPVGGDAQFYKDIPISPMTYGQALTLLILMEGLRGANRSRES